MKKILTISTLSAIALLTSQSSIAAQPDIKILSCVSDGKTKDGKPFHKWKATFDHSLFPKGQLNYELKSWVLTNNPTNGKARTYPLKVTPTTLEFYEKVEFRGMSNYSITVVNRKTLKYQDKHDKTNSGKCTIKSFSAKI